MNSSFRFFTTNLIRGTSRSYFNSFVNANHFNRNSSLLNNLFTKNFRFIHNQVLKHPLKLQQREYSSFTKYSQLLYSRTSFSRTILSRTSFSNYSRNNRNWKSLRNVTIFTVLFCAGTTIATPYLFNNTPLRWFKQNPKAFVYSIMAVNVVVFGLWRLPQCYRFLTRYFLLEKNSMYSSLSMVGSAFSHQDFWHLAMNMLALYSFGVSLIQIVGISNFTMLYFNGAVIASLASLAAPIFLRIPYNIASLGASGALFSVFGTFAYLIPSAQILFFVIPIPGGAWVAFLGSMCWNAAGCFMRWGSFDYAAHLGGSLVGIFYGWLISQQRQKLIEARRKRSSFF